MCISFNSLIGNQSFNTMRVVGFVNGQPCHILIDSGSTHNFLDSSFAKRLKCEVEDIRPMAVSVADGFNIACNVVYVNSCVGSLLGV